MHQCARLCSFCIKQTEPVCLLESEPFVEFYVRPTRYYCYDYSGRPECEWPTRGKIFLYSSGPEWALGTVLLGNDVSSA